MKKKPSNRNSLPKIIISEVDSINILEFKVKYEKLARLDRFVIKSMSYNQNREIIFNEVVANNGALNIEYLDNNKKIKIEVDHKIYTIQGVKVGGKKRKLEDRVSQEKVQLILKDEIKNQQTLSEKEFLHTNKDFLSKVANKEVLTTKDSYLIKRFLSYRSNMQLYYYFLDSFFKVANNNIELWKIDFNKKPQLVEYFIFTINDNLTNSTLKNYIKDKDLVKNDLEKTKEIFSKLRHALMHYDYDFFDKLFKNEDLSLDLDIKFLNNVIDSINNINIESKKEFIDKEELELFGQKIEFSKLYSIYAHITTNRVAFNKLINSFLIKDGKENDKLKEFFKKAKLMTYYIDIHKNSEYEKLYIEHKVLVSKATALTNGKEIADINKKINNLKLKMKEITKANSLSRLEHKLRLAFGFIYSEYSNFKHFKNSFDNDIKKGKFSSISNERLQEYYNLTFEIKSKKAEKLSDISKYIDKITLKDIIQNDTMLKFMLLIFIFLPQEIKGEFLGFLKKYYHDITNISYDTKDKDEFLETLPTSLKLKILTKNIRKLTILKHSLSNRAKYNKKEKIFYEDGNSYGKFYKNLKISHNLEEFNKTIYTPLLKYYAVLFKLINDFEIYTLYKNAQSNESLYDVTQREEFKHKGNYNFRTLMEKNYKDKDYKDIVNFRNALSHINNQALFECPLNLRKNYKAGREIECKNLENMRKSIIKFIENEKQMQKILGYNAINDFTMKIIQLKTKLKVYSNKEVKIDELIKKATTANDYYNIYKLKAIQSINDYLLKAIGSTTQELEIEQKITNGNQNISKP